jgi:GT2 family glycosyltransferase
MDIQLSFVTLSFNSEIFLAKCFDSIISKCQEDCINFEIIVVDNGSNDSSLKIINTYSEKYPDIFKAIFLTKNRGTTYTRNLGLNKAEGEFICILDSDTEILDGCLKEVMEMLEKNEDIGIVAPRLLLPNGSVQNSVKKFPTFWQKISKIPRVIFKIGLPDVDFYEDFPFRNKRFVDSAISACWFIRKDLLSTVGLFDEKIFYAPEDLDYCLRLRNVAKKIQYLPYLTILHHTQQISHKNPFSKVAISHFLGLLYYYGKHGGWFSAEYINREKNKITKPVFLFFLIIFCLFMLGFTIMGSTLWFKLTFWASASFIIAVTFGYPLIMYIFSSIKKHEYDISNIEPAVSLIIAAHNEESVIAKKLENSLKLDYPEEKLEIIVASDGSTDRTNEIVESFKNKDVKLFSYERMGKTGAQNETVKRAKGEIIVFSDANSIYNENAIRKLVRRFGDNNVGCVCGQLVYEDVRSQVATAEDAYWNYEKKLKEWESKVSSLIGANGAIYALRKELYVEIDRELISDLVEPLEIIKRGKKVIYEPEAISVEPSSLLFKDEFLRKVRILTRSINGIMHMRSLFNPFRHGVFALQIILHKFLRYLVPFFLITGLVSLQFLTQESFYFMVCSFIVVFLLFALIGKLSENKIKRFKLFNFCYYYIVVNYALILAWIKVIRRQKFPVWSPNR